MIVLLAGSVSKLGFEFRLPTTPTSTRDTWEGFDAESVFDDLPDSLLLLPRFRVPATPIDGQRPVDFRDRSPRLTFHHRPGTNRILNRNS